MTSHRDSFAVSACTTASALAECCFAESDIAAGSSRRVLASACVPLPGPRHAGAATAPMCAPTDAESSRRILTEAAAGLAQQPQQLFVDEAAGALQPTLTGAATPAQQHEQLRAGEVMAASPVALPPNASAAMPTDPAASTGT